MIIQYIANDGRVFDDEGACEQYEFKQECQKFEDVISGWDCDGNRSPFISPTFLDHAVFITCKTASAVEALALRGEREALNTEGIYNPGAYRWTGENWESVEKRMQELNEELAMLAKIVKDLE